MKQLKEELRQSSYENDRIVQENKYGIRNYSLLNLDYILRVVKFY